MTNRRVKVTNKRVRATNKIDEITMKVNQILVKPYARRLVPDETGGYVASIQEFPGCFAEGNTADEAVINLEHVASSWIEAALSTGYEIRDPYSSHEYSGKLALRLPRGLHQQVAELAELEECSINQLLVTAVSEYQGSKRAFREMSQTLIAEMKKAMTDGVLTFYRTMPATLLISFPTPDKSYFSTGTTIEGQYVAEKVFNLGGTNAID